MVQCEVPADFRSRVVSAGCYQYQADHIMLLSMLCKPFFLCNSFSTLTSSIADDTLSICVTSLTTIDTGKEWVWLVRILMEPLICSSGGKHTWHLRYENILKFALKFLYWSLDFEW